MRFALTLLLSSLVGSLVPAALAVHPTTVAGTSPSRVLAHRQHHHQSRDLIDLCVSIPNLAVNLLSLLGLKLNLCLCLQNLNIYLETIDDVSLQNKVLAHINATINDPNTDSRCALPRHAHRACTNANPCHYECDTGFTSVGNQCICAAPKVICNDQCVDPGTAGCAAPSAVPRSLKSRHSLITTFARAQASCGTKTVCGVAEPKTAMDFECVEDVTSNFDSCGGCSTPHPFKDAVPAPPGVDCGRISNAAQVSCQKSKCVIQQCHDGFKFDDAANECVVNGLLAHTGARRMRRGKSRHGLLGITSDPVSIAGQVLGIPLALDPKLAPSLVSTIATTAAINNAGSAADVTGLVNSVAKMLGSPAATFPANINSSIVAAGLLKDKLAGCGCDLLKNVGDLLDHLLGLAGQCSTGTPTVPAPAACLTADLSHVVCSLLPGVYISPIVICGLLGPGLTSTLENLLNGLGIGILPPATQCLDLPATPVDPSLPSASVSASASVSVSAPAASASVAPSAPPTPSASVSASASVSVSAPAASAPVAPSAPPTPSTVISLAGIVINLGLQVNLGGSIIISLPSAGSCGLLPGLIDAINNLVQSLLGTKLLGPDSILGRDLLGGLLGLNLGDLGGITGGNTLNALGLENTLGGLGLTPLVNNVIALLNGVSSSCGASGALSGLSATVDSLLVAVNNLLGAGSTCKCWKDPAVVSGIAALAAQAAPNAPTLAVPAPPPPPGKRAFRNRSPRTIDSSAGVANSALAPALRPPMTSAISSTIAISGMQKSIPATAPSVSPMLAAFTALLGCTPSSFSSKVDEAVDATKAFQNSMDKCGCADTLGLGKLIAYVDQLLAQLVSMQSYCGSNAPTVPGPASCLTVDVSHVVCSLLDVYISPLLVCSSLLGPDLTASVQNALNDLDIGLLPPAKQCPSAPATAALPPADLVATSPAPSADPTGDVVNLAVVLLGLGSTLSLGSADLTGSPGICSQLFVATTDLLDHLLGPKRLSDPSVGNLAGVLGGILGCGDAPALGALLSGGLLNGGGDPAGLKPLVDRLLALLDLAGGDSSCGCNKTAIALTPTVQAILPAVDKLLAASNACYCRGSAPMLAAVSALLPPSGASSSIL
ncbi:hypothetical protein C8J57DRAFT_365925 [Mycena rebaudengoi]|nr:hypothetical protein C8J57DRAFT_365925 [Mycena rebaudengoi]